MCAPTTCARGFAERGLVNKAPQIEAPRAWREGRLARRFASKRDLLKYFGWRDNEWHRNVCRKALVKFAVGWYRAEGVI